MKHVLGLVLAVVMLTGCAGMNLNFAGNEQAAEVAIEIAARRMTAVFCDKFEQDIEQGLVVTQALFVALDTPDTERFFSGVVRTTATFTVTVFGKTQAGADALADIDRKVFDLLDQVEVAVIGHDRGYIRGVSRGAPTIEGEYLRLDSTFQIVATTTS